jgi:hypothetical protein
MMILQEKLFLFYPTLSLDAPSKTEKTKIFDSTRKLFSISRHPQNAERLTQRTLHSRRRKGAHKEKPQVDAPTRDTKDTQGPERRNSHPDFTTKRKEAKREDLLA